MKINSKTAEAYQLFHNGILAFSRAEQQGFRINLHYCEVVKKHLTRKIERKERKLKETKFYKHWKHVMGAVNINSNPSLSIFLYKIKKIKPTHTTKTGQGSTNNEALSALNIPELNTILEIRKLKKLRDTYLDAFIREQVKGYIHPSFNLHFAVSFRSSSNSPNFQNIPKRDKESRRLVRKAIYPSPGHQLMEFDYSGVEFRIAGCYYKDPTMLEYIQKDADIHGDIAARVFLIKDFDRSVPVHSFLRSAAKNGFVFPQLYGSWYKNCAETLAIEWGGMPKGKWTKKDGVIFEGLPLGVHLLKNKIDNIEKFAANVKTVEDYFWNDVFKTGKRWQKRWWRDYQKKGYVESLTGFRYSGKMSLNKVLNYPIQGAAFHCLLWTFNRIDKIMREENWNTKIIGQIHDAIIFDLDPTELNHVSKTVRKVMCKDLPKAWKWINVPIDVDAELAGIDESWADVKDYDLVKHTFKAS